MSTMALTANSPPKKAAPLTYFLGEVFVVFIGVLIFCYVITKRTNPVFLDEHGKVVTSSGHDHAGQRSNRNARERMRTLQFAVRQASLYAACSGPRSKQGTLFFAAWAA